VPLELRVLIEVEMIRLVDMPVEPVAMNTVLAEVRDERRLRTNWAGPQPNHEVLAIERCLLEVTNDLLSRKGSQTRDGERQRAKRESTRAQAANQHKVTSNREPAGGDNAQPFPNLTLVWSPDRAPRRPPPSRGARRGRVVGRRQVQLEGDEGANCVPRACAVKTPPLSNRRYPAGTRPVASGWRSGPLVL